MIENISQLICRTNKLIGFNTMTTLPFSELRLLFVSGEIIGINHTELVGQWHFAYLFFRGNCENESGNFVLIIAFYTMI